MASALAGLALLITPELCSTAVAPALGDLARDRTWSARQAAARALPRLAAAAGSQQCALALQLLQLLMDDASSWVRGAALLAAGPVLCCAQGLPIPAGALPAEYGQILPYRLPYG